MVKHEPNIHRPSHDKKCVPGEYFLTGRIFDQNPLLKSEDRKNEFLDLLVEFCIEYDLELFAWVVNDDHYHASVFSDHTFDLSRFMNRLHSVTATRFNKTDSTPGRRVWYQYWDHRIRDEVDSWKHFNYNHWNPIKHGYVKDMIELAEYPFSSYLLWFELLGQEAVEIFFESYPVEDFDPFN